jgi:hypothetical protein
MYYQLPNGKTIWLDISDVLNLTDQDIRDLVSMNIGEHVHNPWQNSSINTREEKDNTDDEDEDDESDIEYYYKEYYPDEFPDDPDELDLSVDPEV